MRHLISDDNIFLWYGALIFLTVAVIAFMGRRGNKANNLLPILRTEGHADARLYIKNYDNIHKTYLKEYLRVDRNFELAMKMSIACSVVFLSLYILF